MIIDRIMLLEPKKHKKFSVSHSNFWRDYIVKIAYTGILSQNTSELRIWSMFDDCWQLCGMCPLNLKKIYKIFSFRALTFEWMYRFLWRTMDNFFKDSFFWFLFVLLWKIQKLKKWDIYIYILIACNQQFINILFLPTLITQVVIGLSDGLYQIRGWSKGYWFQRISSYMAQSRLKWPFTEGGWKSWLYWLTMTLFCDKLLCHMLLSFYLWNCVFGLGAELILKAGNISPQCDWFSCYPEFAIDEQEVVKTPTPTIHVNDHFLL